MYSIGQPFIRSRCREPRSQWTGSRYTKFSSELAYDMTGLDGGIYDDQEGADGSYSAAMIQTYMQTETIFEKAVEHFPTKPRGRKLSHLAIEVGLATVFIGSTLTWLFRHPILTSAFKGSRSEWHTVGQEIV